MSGATGTTGTARATPAGRGLPWSKNQAKRALGAVRVLLRAKPEAIERATANGNPYVLVNRYSPDPAQDRSGPVVPLAAPVSPGAAREVRDAFWRLRDVGLDGHEVIALRDLAMTPESVLLALRAGLRAQEVIKHQREGTTPDAESLAVLAAMRA